jgi:hypothetical protein
MRKSFPLQLPGKADARVLDLIKHEVRKYVKRERRKPLPAESVEWSFACKVGPAPALAEAVPLKEISAAVDRVAQGTNHEVYIEIIATPSVGRAPGAIG